MKTVLIIVVAVMAMVLCGWLTFATSDEAVSITIDKAEVKKDTSKAVEVGEKLLDKVSESTQDSEEQPVLPADDELDESSDDSAAIKPATPPEKE